MNNEPVAWMLKTGHGTKIVEKKPYCEVDYWQGLYTQNQLNQAVLLERESCAKLCESLSERDKITALIGSGYAHNIRNQK